MPGGFGGDSSVKWFVHADNGRAGSVRSERPDPGPRPKRWRQEGIDEWEPAAAYDFTITIKIPKDSARSNAKATFVAGLRAAADAAESAPLNSGGAVSFRLPVEDKDHGGPNLDQIVVDWQPATTGV
jgi:hypothetical protein